MAQKYIEGDLVRIKTEPNNLTPNKIVYKFVNYVTIDKVLIRTINSIADAILGLLVCDKEFKTKFKQFLNETKQRFQKEFDEL